LHGSHATDYYIVQDPTTKRCRIIEERPAPGVGPVIGGLSFGVRTEAESRMSTVEECRESGTTGGGVIIQSVNGFPCLASSSMTFWIPSAAWMSRVKT